MTNLLAALALFIAPNGSRTNELLLPTTAYVWTNKKCANNEWPVPYVSCAAPRYVPLGTWLDIEGVGLRRCDDHYRADLSDRIDLYCARGRAAALRWGIRKRKVSVVKR
jgi:3D (Asp-Asp-Asp) domain-containing protein